MGNKTYKYKHSIFIIYNTTAMVTTAGCLINKGMCSIALARTNLILGTKRGSPVAEHMLSICEALRSIPSATKKKKRRRRKHSYQSITE
jgi:hypothetical protein